MPIFIKNITAHFFATKAAYAMIFSNVMYFVDADCSIVICVFYCYNY